MPLASYGLPFFRPVRDGGTATGGSADSNSNTGTRPTARRTSGSSAFPSGIHL